MSIKKFYVAGLALVAVLAFSALASSSAFAVSKYLLNGAQITTTIPTVTEGELLLEDTAATGKPDILCMGSFDGTIGPPEGTKDQITEVLNLEKVLVAGELANSDLIANCETDNGTCTNPVDVEAVNLPWNTEVMLTPGGKFSDLLVSSGNGEPGWRVDCNSIIGLISDTCTGEGNASAELTNIAGGGVLGTFLETETDTISPPAHCSLNGGKTGLVVGSSPITSTSETLTLSE